MTTDCLALLHAIRASGLAYVAFGLLSIAAGLVVAVRMRRLQEPMIMMWAAVPFVFLYGGALLVLANIPAAVGPAATAKYQYECGP